MFKLRVYVEDDDLRNIYRQHIASHNHQFDNDDPYFNAGFDIICPKNEEIQFGYHKKISMKIKCAGYDKYERPIGFTMWPRSSLSKTPLRIANSAGIFDSGYRGDVIAAFDCVKLEPYLSNSVRNDDGDLTFELKKGNKYVQICSPMQNAFHVELVDNLSDLGITERGAGGFGSTGN